MRYSYLRQKLLTFVNHLVGFRLGDVKYLIEQKQEK